MATPTPVFPAAVATDAQLKVANNLITTTLAAAIDGVTTILAVTSTTGFVVNGLISIDNEIMSISSISTGQLTVAGRGFDGTTAAAHSAGVKVSMFIDAWHHNVVAAEIKAIEGFIGANGLNISGNYPYLVSAPYIFPPQAPGGSLIVGNNSINLSPVPKGVNGSDVGHYVYISGGTGTPEAALITGGSAVSGAASGTLIIQCANTHSGAWTIQSATAGIQEAVNSLPGGRGYIAVPAGTFNVWGPVTVTGSGVVISGAGRYATLLTDTYTAGPMFNYSGSGVGSNNQLNHMEIDGPNTGSNYAVVISQQNSFSMEDVTISATGGGIQITGGSTFRVLIDNVNVSNFTGKGISIEGGGDHFLSRLNISGNSVAGTVGIGVSTTGGTWIRDIDVIVCDVGLLINPTGMVQWVWMTDSAFDTSLTTGIYITPAAGGTVRGVNIVNCWTATASGAAGDGVHGTGAVIGSTGTVDGVRFIGHRFVNNYSVGLTLFGGTHITITACVFAGNGYSTNNGNGIYVEPGVSNWTVRGSQLGQSEGFNNTQTYGIVIAAGASDNFVIENNDFLANLTGPMQNNATGTHNIIRNNHGYNPVGASGITVTASPFTYTAGASPETVYIQGGTVTSIVRGGQTLATSAASTVTVALAPNQNVVVTYTAPPTTMFRDIG